MPDDDDDDDDDTIDPKCNVALQKNCKLFHRLAYLLVADGYERGR